MFRCVVKGYLAERSGLRRPLRRCLRPMKSRPAVQDKNIEIQSMSTWKVQLDRKKVYCSSNINSDLPARIDFGA